MGALPAPRPPEGRPIGPGREDPNQDPSTRSGRQVHLSVMLARDAGPPGAKAPAPNRRRASAVGVIWPQDANRGGTGPNPSPPDHGSGRTPTQPAPPEKRFPPRVAVDDGAQ